MSRAIVSGRASFALRAGPVSVRLRPTVLAGTAALAIAVLAALAWDLAVGEVRLPVGDVVAALLGGGDRASRLVVNELRLPRAATALLAGAALGLSGALLQSLTRNPLASPDLIGITAGAGTGAVTVIVLAGGSGGAVVAAAFGGATVTATAMYALAYRQGVAGHRLVLVGIALGSMASSITAWLLTRTDLVDLSRATIWLIGSLNARGWPQARPVLVVLAVGIPVVAVLARSLRAMGLGDDTARGLGVPVGRIRLVLLAAAVLLAAVATAACGPVAFVALVAPHVSRLLLRTPDAPLLPSALVGALVMLVSDLASRRLFAPTELPVGLVTGVIGAPVLVAVLVAGRRAAR